MDCIKIENLEIFANHGVFPEETKLGQKFQISCVLSLDTREAGKTDDLNKSVNYGTVCHLIKKEMEEHTFMLIEAVAEHLADVILTFDTCIREVEVEVKKLWAPIGLPLDTVSVKIRRKWHEVYVALGSNMGDKRGYIEQAVEKIEDTKNCRVECVSELLETEPYGEVEQDQFLNGALKLWTTFSPEELLERIHEIEQEAGRERLIHWGPRTLDLDILLYDDEVIGENELCIPHVDMQNRQFVLEPMVEIAPYKRHPVYGKTMKELLEDLISKN